MAIIVTATAHRTSRGAAGVEKYQRRDHESIQNEHGTS
jgi:hypothetical protein